MAPAPFRPLITQPVRSSTCKMCRRCMSPATVNLNLRLS